MIWVPFYYKIIHYKNQFFFLINFNYIGIIILIQFKLVQKFGLRIIMFKGTDLVKFKKNIFY